MPQNSDLQTLTQLMQLAAPQAQPQDRQQMMMRYHQQQLQQQALQHRDEIGFRQQELAQRQGQFEYAKQQAEPDKRMQLAQQMIDTNLRMGKPMDSQEILALLQEFGPMGERVREKMFQSHADRGLADVKDYLESYRNKPSPEGFAKLDTKLQGLGLLHPEVQKYIPWGEVNAGIPFWEQAKSSDAVDMSREFIPPEYLKPAPNPTNTNPTTGSAGRAAMYTPITEGLGWFFNKAATQGRY